MAESVKRERPLTLKEERQASASWENWQSPSIIRFQISETHCIGIPFNSISSTECIQREDGSCEMGIEWKDNDKVRSIFITGPKVPELFTQFCLHVVCLISADGKDITRVDLLVAKESDKDSG